MSKSNQNKLNRLYLIIDRFEGDKAVLKFNGSQTLIVDTSFLSVDSKEGDLLEINFKKNIIKQKEQETAVKNIIKEILDK